MLAKNLRALRRERSVAGPPVLSMLGALLGLPDFTTDRRFMYAKSLIVVKQNRVSLKQSSLKMLVFLRFFKFLEGLRSSGRLVARIST